MLHVCDDTTARTLRTWTTIPIVVITYPTEKMQTWKYNLWVKVTLVTINESLSSHFKNIMQHRAGKPKLQFSYRNFHLQKKSLKLKNLFFIIFVHFSDF